MLSHVSSMSVTCQQHVSSSSHVVLLGGTATLAAATILSTVTNSVEEYKIEAKTARVASVISPRKTYFVDLHNRLCACLHHQIYHYCAHVLHAAEFVKDHILAAITREHMDSETVNTVDIGYWRFIGRDDREIVSDFSGSDLLSSYGVALSADEFQPSNIGNDTTRHILKLLQTMTPQDRALINDELMVIVDKCISRQVVSLISVKVSKSHNGNRQDSDRVVKPLYAQQHNRKRKNDLVKNAADSAPKLRKTEKISKVQQKKTDRSGFIGTQTFDEYQALPNATLSENVTRRKDEDV
jgi:hypothetical protein